jgi:hypothetical protein
VFDEVRPLDLIGGTLREESQGLSQRGGALAIDAWPRQDGVCNS